MHLLLVCEHVRAHVCVCAYEGELEGEGGGLLVQVRAGNVSTAHALG